MPQIPQCNITKHPDDILYENLFLFTGILAYYQIPLHAGQSKICHKAGPIIGGRMPYDLRVFVSKIFRNDFIRKSLETIHTLYTIYHYIR